MQSLFAFNAQKRRCRMTTWISSLTRFRDLLHCVCLVTCCAPSPSPPPPPCPPRPPPSTLPPYPPPLAADCYSHDVEYDVGPLKTGDDGVELAVGTLASEVGEEVQCLSRVTFPPPTTETHKSANYTGNVPITTVGRLIYNL